MWWGPYQLASPPSKRPDRCPPNDPTDKGRYGFAGFSLLPYDVAASCLSCVGRPFPEFLAALQHTYDVIFWCRFTTEAAYLELWSLAGDDKRLRTVVGHGAEWIAQIHQLKVEQACHRHKEMLDDAIFELEGCEEDSDLLCNIPPKMAFLLSTPLKHIGVTRTNINSRRFSLC
ncbi:hypothetical protein NXF25_001974 [Crotalus adamanteus]|uniref:Uncharacterized protein n=1 Tax=Crotalus adamanteus TaxID=8729 RepID=A0AAW1C8K4_CROAD